MKLEDIKSQEQLDAFIQEKADASFKAGLAKAKTSSSLSADEKANFETKLKEKEDALNKALKELKPFKEEQAYQADLKTFREAGGLEDVDLSDYNYKKYSGEDGKVNYEEFFKKHPSLKKQDKKLNKDKTLGKSGKVVIDSKEEEDELKLDSKLSGV